MDKSAIISKCGNYRYLLRRIWGEGDKMISFVMLNPSTADSFEDDPTIRRCIGFAQKWGFSGMYILNLFAYRSTDPKELLKVDDPIGESNQMYLSDYTSISEMIVLAWGNYSIVEKLKSKFPEYSPYVRNKKPELHCLGQNIKGDPKHPLYLKKDLKPINYKKPK